LPASPFRLRFRTDGTDILVQTEESDGTIIGCVPWHAGDPAETFAERLAGLLRTLDRYPGDASFDPSSMLQQLLKVIRIGIEARSGERADDLGSLIEMPNEHWAISSEGLFSLQRSYHISAERIVDAHEDWPLYMRGQAWVDLPAFEEAYTLA